MKACKQLFTMCLLAVFAACSDDTFVPQAEVDSTAESGSVDLVCMVVPDIEMDVTTRSKLYEDGDALKFEWQENDAIGVIPMTGNPLRFPIHAENAGKNTALFDGGGWALKSDEKYAAFYPYKKENYEKDVKSITYSYYGQTQGNFSYYDFLATGAVMPSNGQVTFNMKRLSAILKFSITMPADSYGRYGSLVSPDADFGVEGTLDLSGSEPIMKKSYSKTVNTQIAADKTSSSEWTYEVYLMIPATNLSGKELMFRITSDNGDAYEVPLEGKNFEAGKAYLLDGEAGEAKIRNKNLIQASVGKTTYMYVTDSEGNLCVNQSRVAINAVKKINVSQMDDPTVCDEIGYFQNLEELECRENGITSLDVSKNTLLKSLDCNYNQLTSADFSNNILLNNLYLFRNQLTSLDISKNIELILLACNSNRLTSLDISNNRLLEDLICGNNRITSLDVSNNTKLVSLNCSSTYLSFLDVSNNPALEYFDCTGIWLTSLDVSKNLALIRLDCSWNFLTTLDVSNNTALTSLYCYNNPLTDITGLFNCKNLETLMCGETFMTSLSITSSFLPNLKYLDLKGSRYLTNLAVYLVPTLVELDVENCKSLSTLNCYGNKLASLDISTCTALTRVRCFNNQMTTLNIAKNTLLTMSNVQCGGQKTSSGADRTITLTVNDTQYADKDNLSTSNNTNVTIVKE